MTVRSVARILAGGLCIVAAPFTASAKDIYLAPGGNDLTGAGTTNSPYGTFSKAITAAAAGDVIVARGGTYNLASQLTINKAGGTATTPYQIVAFNGEVPVLDFSTEAAGTRGIQIDSNYWTLKGLTVRNAKDNGIHITGSNNTLDNLRVYGNQDSGVQLAGTTGTNARSPANNLILNVDSYSNYDPAAHGENADGFAAKFRELGAGNVFRGVRAWGNSDDGFDFWGAADGVTVENSWAYKNGFNTFGDTAYAGDGNGMKLGHDSGKHVVKNVLVWGNRLNGIDVNGNAQTDVAPADPIEHGVTIENVTAYLNGAGGNGYNFNFDEAFAHVLKNNVSLQGGSGGTNSANMKSGVVNDHNTWNGIPVDANDFKTLSDAIATGARNADGSLPFSDFLRLLSNSNLIDAGTNVGMSYNGTAPDLGAFEFSPVPEPSAISFVAGAIFLSTLRGRRAR